MYISTLELSEFRNFENLNIGFSEGINIFYGDNAQGKSNLLEAMFMISTTKSHRGVKDKDLIRFGKEEAHIKTILYKGELDYRIDMHLKKGRSKGIALNGSRLKKASDLVGLLNIILFSPEDLSIIKNGPAERRRFLDIELCQLDKNYLNDLSRYTKSVEQRNKLLKEIEKHPAMEDTLDIWDDQLLLNGTRIIERRKKFMDELNEILPGIHSRLTGGKEKLELKYLPNTEIGYFQKQLRSRRRVDILQKMTTVGPHRDDFEFEGDIDYRRFGSQGQQRTCALSLKLSEIEIVRKITGEDPVLMLDDVLSELDVHRQNDLMTTIGGLQTCITCTGLDEFVNGRFSMDRIYRVEEGKVLQQS